MLYVCLIVYGLAMTIICAVQKKLIALEEESTKQCIAKMVEKDVDLISQISKLKSWNINARADVIDAVYYAMKKAHPDNGGKEEDFIKFKKLHDELTSRK